MYILMPTEKNGMHLLEEGIMLKNRTAPTLILESI